MIKKMFSVRLFSLPTVMLAALGIWHFVGIDWAFYFLLIVNFLDFTFCIGSAFDSYDEFGDWHGGV